MEEKLVYQIGLTLLPNVGPITAKNLVSYCGSAEGVFRSSSRSLRKIPGIGPRIAQLVNSKQVLNQAAREVELIEKHGIQAVYYLDERYPKRLQRIEESPVLLFQKGPANLQADRIIAIVGTRRASLYGIQQCEHIVAQLAPYQPLIISGLAYGIDAAAHRASVSSGLSTIGVMANGLGQIYPAAHRRLSDAMLERGALLTEHLYQTKPEREHFPMRNRIIAGLCDALLVVESGSRGGSLITAEFANRYHKDVFALPGRVTDDLSSGCLMLIKHNKASLFESPGDIPGALGWDEEPPATAIQRSLFQDLKPREKIIVDLLRDDQPLGIDQLIDASAMSNSELVALLLELEFKGVVRSLPGKQYAIP